MHEMWTGGVEHPAPPSNKPSGREHWILSRKVPFECPKQLAGDTDPTQTAPSPTQDALR